MTKKTTKKAAKQNAKEFWQGRGRRKTAQATVRLFKGKEEVIINNKPPAEYLKNESSVLIFLKPIEQCNLSGKFSISVKVKGGGKEAQIDAIKLGVARALTEYDKELRPVLRREGFLTRDPREKERKKPGLKRARRAPQWQKR